NHRFEIGKGWSQPEIPDYFRPSQAKKSTIYRVLVLSAFSLNVIRASNPEPAGSRLLDFHFRILSKTGKAFSIS
ncbi:hypothetical protein, partial [Pseudomonas aeruginosa]|uniref:hypothetical protein n=2 Tax=Pseudomonas aeruginosa TaxID=287 RepID=UPI001CD1B460